MHRLNLVRHILCPAVKKIKTRFMQWCLSHFILLITTELITIKNLANKPGMSKDTAAFCASEYLNNKNSITRKNFMDSYDCILCTLLTVLKKKALLSISLLFPVKSSDYRKLLNYTVPLCSLCIICSSLYQCNRCQTSCLFRHYMNSVNLISFKQNTGKWNSRIKRQEYQPFIFGSE